MNRARPGQLLSVGEVIVTTPKGELLGVVHATHAGQ